ncbi:hypothetical protein C8J57DRAFT_1411159 [Mycena rebaudengoi]|nr:hypothetical protein C8J57DRAFT_1411159 [Mycena rebaudengoi]
MVEAHRKQLATGLTAEQVKFTTSLPVLCDASVKPIVDLFGWSQSLTGKELIKRAWEKCTVGEYNFSAECLMSKKTKAAYREYLRNNPDFRKEIEDKIGNVLELDSSEPGNEDYENDETDDTDVPLHCVIQESLQLDITPSNLPSTNKFCVASDTVAEGEDGFLSGGGDVENIWAYNDNGVPWSEGNLAIETFASR